MILRQPPPYGLSAAAAAVCDRSHKGATYGIPASHFTLTIAVDVVPPRGRRNPSEESYI
jgi:hypothetical protein